MSNNHAARWEKYTKRGKWLFVLGLAVLFTTFQLFFRVLGDWILDDSIRPLTLSTLVIYSLGGLLVAVFTWWIGNSRYQKFLESKR